MKKTLKLSWPDIGCVALQLWSIKWCPDIQTIMGKNIDQFHIKEHFPNIYFWNLAAYVCKVAELLTYGYRLLSTVFNLFLNNIPRWAKLLFGFLDSPHLNDSQHYCLAHLLLKNKWGRMTINGWVILIIDKLFSSKGHWSAFRAASQCTCHMRRQVHLSETSYIMLRWVRDTSF